MDTLEKESGGGQSVRSSERRQIPSSRPQARTRFLLARGPSSTDCKARVLIHIPDIKARPPMLESETLPHVWCPPSLTTASPEDQEQHPADVKLSSLLRQFQDVVGESSQSRIETDREHVERERELQAQISALSDERDNAVRSALEKEEKLKTLALDLWELEKLRKNLQAKLEQGREGQSGVNVRLKTLAKEKRQLEKELSAFTADSGIYSL
ncbi:hypothetical protein D9619_012435 [Psilocybe cf. subviscida]|uniref:Uncharacterized protein n=1 Tax=Psilocybe cf. subviscida TaxID=2480587 RepID=A0A8H5AQZ1_9AGAR|nr:hypothetical protein D9619_012435 [Psilocybe cf. subviscida]